MASVQFEKLPRYIAGSGGGIVACYFLATKHADPSIAIASAYFILVCIYDTLKSKIPNILNASLAIVGLASFFYDGGWTGLLTGIAGLALGIALLLTPWLMGGMGAGDVKALGALGALIGPGQLIHVFVYMGLIGGIMAILHYLFERNLSMKTADWLTSLKATILTSDPRMIIPGETTISRFPYAAAITFGYYTYLTFGKVL